MGDESVSVGGGPQKKAVRPTERPGPGMTSPIRLTRPKIDLAEPDNTYVRGQNSIELARIEYEFFMTWMAYGTGLKEFGYYWI